LVDSDMESFWQSDGSRPHWVQFAFPGIVKINKVLVFLDYLKDRSFTPKSISVKIGSSDSDLYQVAKYHHRQGPGAWVNILSSTTHAIETCLLRIVVHENQDTGCNSRIRGIKLL
ncbi:hypothetical protein GUITHDRAFT_52998, partial [Guillardia theta CCMP2712]